MLLFQKNGINIKAEYIFHQAPESLRIQEIGKTPKIYVNL